MKHAAKFPDNARSANLPLPQSFEFERMLKRVQRKTKRLERDDDQLGGLMVQRHRVWFASRADWNAEHLAMARDHGLWVVNSEHATPMAGFGKIITGAFVAELSTDANWLQGAKRNWRNGLRQAERKKIRVYDGRLDPSRDQWLLNQAAAQGRQRGYQNWPAALTCAYGAANPGAARIFWTESDGAPCAGVLILRHGARGTYHLSWSNEAGRQMDANRVLLARAVAWLRETGAKQLDLGIIDSENASGLAEFKLGTGAQLRQLGGTWLAYPRWRRRPLGATPHIA